MKKNHDIYEDDFNELSGNYKDLVSKPTIGEVFAEAVSKAGATIGSGPMNANANALMNGIAAGFKGTENLKRQERLEPLYQMVAENTARAAMIRAQVQEAEKSRLLATK